MNKIRTKVIWMNFAPALILLFFSGCSDAPDRDDLVARYPDVESGSPRPENKEVLCPFLRMIERSGLFDNEESSVIPYGVLSGATAEFGCGSVECRTVAQIASVGQGNPAGVDIENLHESGLIAHDCGLTFELGGTSISDTVRNATLARLAEFADENGRLVYTDLQAVKLEICEAQGVDISGAGNLEVRLIFAYLGGVDRGYILHSDVVRFLHASMPETITEKLITAGLLSRVN
jgi:hypothetical protein